MPRAHPRWGYEFDWLAVDAAGHVAVLSAGGYGAVPIAVNAASEHVDAAIDMVVRLLATGRARRDRRRGGGDVSDWLRYSSQGLYAYDWDDHHGPYRRVCRPSSPVHVDQLPEPIGAVARLSPLDLELAGTSVIEVAYAEPPDG